VQAVAPVTPRQFAWFRIVFGTYLAVHFAHLTPWAAELFSREGVLPTADLNPTHGILPNLLAWSDSPAFVTGFLIVLAGLSVLFAAGICRHAAALLLWYGWACLFNRNVLISNPSIAYVGLLLLLTTLVPAREPFRVFGHKASSDKFYVPAGAYWTAWVLIAAGYTFSGIVKLASPSWVDGTAFWHVVHNPLARDGALRDLVLEMPAWGFQWLTWKSLALEILFLPLALWRWTRPLIWLAMVGMHLGIVALVSFADLSIGMLMVHLFTVDSRWPAMLSAIRARHRLLTPAM
jgi:hypothetical protein